MEGKSGRYEKITAWVLFGFSLVYFLGSLRMKMGTTRNPGPGFIPLITGSLLLLCTAAYLFRVLRAKPGGREEAKAAPRGEKNYLAIFGILGCTLAYPFLLEYGKFIVSTFAVAYVMLVLLKPSRSLFPFFLALGMAVGSFLIFSLLLGVALPSGFLEELLFRIGG
jgi:hypothetical protein